MMTECFASKRNTSDKQKTRPLNEQGVSKNVPKYYELIPHIKTMDNFYINISAKMVSFLSSSHFSFKKTQQKSYLFNGS